MKRYHHPIIIRLAITVIVIIAIDISILIESESVSSKIWRLTNYIPINVSHSMFVLLCAKNNGLKG